MSEQIGPPSDDPFDTGDSWPSDQPDPLEDGPEAPSPAPQPQAEPAPEAPAPDDQAAEATEEQPPEGEGPPEPEALIFGRFRTMEDAERAYQQQQDDRRRVATERNQLRREMEQMRQQFQQALPQLLQQQQQAQPPPPMFSRAQLEARGIDPEQAEVFEQMLRTQAQQQQQEFASRFEAEAAARAQAAQQAEFAGILATFRARHTDLTEQVEEDISSLFEELELDPMDPVMYEVALEAVNRPALAQVLEANPDWVKTEAGMDFAREQAQMREARSLAASRAQPGAPAPAQPARTPEAALLQGGSGAPPGAPQGQQRPKDEFDEVLADAQQDSASIYTR